MRLIISTGQGRLHLIEVAGAIQSAGVDVRMITGWVPRHTPRWLIDAFGRLIIGRKNLAYGLAKRGSGQVPLEKIQSCAAAEFYQQALLVGARAGLMSRADAKVRGWRAFGRASRKYLHDAEVVQFRTGSGRGGAMDTARSRGMLTIADHSIAHPQIIDRNVRAAYKAHGQPLDINPDDPFWGSVLEDCAEADAILVNSDYVRQSFGEAGWDTSRIHVAYLGVREDFLGLKTDWSRGERLRLLFTGGFNLRKAADVLLEAVDAMLERGLAVELDVVGTVSPYVKLPARLADSPHVRLHGHVPQDALAEYLRQADVYVFPSRAEGAAQSAMEALGAGQPAVVTRESGVPVRDGETGLIVPRDDAEALVAAVERLGDDAALREKLGQAAATMVRDHHRWPHHGQAVRAVYERLLGDRDGGGSARGREN